MAKVIDMALHLAYYEAMKRGTKKVEYRNMSDYWIGKLLDVKAYGGKSIPEIKDGLVKGKLPIHPYGWEEVRFHHLQDPILQFKIDGIEVYEGHTTFAIKLGKRLA